MSAARQHDLLVEAGVRIGGQGAPVRHRLLPGCPLGGHRPAHQIAVGGIVRRHQPGARAGLDRHVADRHAAFHRHGADHFARILDDMAGAARGPDLADDRQNDVLGRDAERQGAVDRDPHVLRASLDQGLGRQHVLDLGGADAEGERAERAVRRGVAVAAHDRRAGQGEALLGADDVDDALADVLDVEQGDAEVPAVLLQGLDLDARGLVGDALGAVGGRHVVVGHRERRIDAAHRAAALAQAFEGLRAGHLVHEMTVDVEERRAVVFLVHHVGVPDLVEQGLGHRQASSCSIRRRDSRRDPRGIPTIACARRPTPRSRGRRQPQSAASSTGSPLGAGLPPLPGRSSRRSAMRAALPVRPRR